MATGACASSARPARADDATNLRLSLPLGKGTLFYTVSSRLAKNVEQRSGGRLTIEIFPSAQLANERESIAGLLTGTVDLTIQTSVWLTPLVPNFAVLDMPFIFRNTAQAYRAADSGVGAELFAELEPLGITGLGYGSGGFRQMETVAKPVVTPDDMKGLRMRIQTGGIYIALMQALGAIPVAIDFSETYPALSQHTVDGLEISFDPLITSKLYGVIKHVAVTNHIFAFAPILASKQKLDALPPDLQAILRDEVKSAIAFWRSLYDQQEIQNGKFLRDQGLAFTQIDYAAFRKAMEPVYTSYQAKIGKNLVERITSS